MADETLAKPVIGSNLDNLIKFEPKSKLLSSDENVRRAEFLKLATGIDTSAREQMRARDLLGVVLAISARTRRVVKPKATISVSVFSPNGKRAVTLLQG